MSNLAFVDTNVLVYAHAPHEGPKYDTAITVLDGLWRSGSGVLSTQVLQEFYSIATQKLKPKMSHAEARRRVVDYSEWCSMDTNPQLLVAASRLQENHRLQWWDALIVEAAMRSGAGTLLSEDLKHGRRFGEMTVRNPFEES